MDQSCPFEVILIVLVCQMAGPNLSS